MSIWEAPAKLNLWLRLSPPTDAGYHPLESLVQTVEWCDLLTVEEAEDDSLEVIGADLPTGGENLVWQAVSALRGDQPRLDIRLDKRIAVCAGLGGGSADAAAALRAVETILGRSPGDLTEVAAGLGADVPYFLTGGTAHMSGYGERIEPSEPLEGFVVGVVVPPFELSTAAVYRRWDELEGPEGPAVEGRGLPPRLRDLAPLVNDLTPAACDLRPELADWIADLSQHWERPVAMTGSGPALFGFFADLDEASDAVAAAPEEARAATAARLRTRGVGEIPDDGTDPAARG